MAELLTSTEDLESVANAIRAKGNTSGQLTYPVGFVNAIAAIASDCNATAGDMLSGKTAWVGNAKVTGSISSKAAATYNTSTSDQSIASGQYLSGAQTIKGVTTSNISAGNIRKGVVVKVGDANNAGRIANVTGTCVQGWIPNTLDYLPFMYYRQGGSSYSDQIIPWEAHQESGAPSNARNAYGIIPKSWQGRNFYVPTGIKITYYPYPNSSGTSTLTLSAGTQYSLTASGESYYSATYYVAKISGTWVWKITGYTYA